MTQQVSLKQLKQAGLRRCSKCGLVKPATREFFHLRGDAQGGVRVRCIDCQRRPRPSDAERFWSKVKRGADDDCWEWQASRDRAGYGWFGFRGRVHKSHRVSWMLANGDIPAGLFVMHACDNPPCVNPSHLSLGTASANAADRNKKGRTARGDRHGRRSARRENSMIDT